MNNNPPTQIQAQSLSSVYYPPESERKEYICGVDSEGVIVTFAGSREALALANFIISLF